MRFIPLTPQKLPQDTLRIPGGFGAMGAIDLQNAVQVKREFFVYSTTFANIGYGETQTNIIPTDQDGDFWMTNIVNDPFIGAQAVGVDLWANMNVQDLKNNYELFTPSVQLEQFNKFGVSSNVPGNGTTASVTNILQPYCFTRDGGIKVTMSLLPKSVARVGFTIYLSFLGWKEYQNVSQ